MEPTPKKKGKRSAVKGKKKKEPKKAIENIHHGKYSNQVKVLALDIATTTGFYDGVGAGRWHFDTAKGESKLIRFSRFYDTLIDYYSLHADRIELVAYEQIPMYNKFPNIMAVEMIGVLKFFCFRHELECKGYPALSLKKFATGYGMSPKERMIEEAYKQYNIVPADDNVADAIHLYHMAKSDIEQNGKLH